MQISFAKILQVAASFSASNPASRTPRPVTFMAAVPPAPTAEIPDGTRAYARPEQSAGMRCPSRGSPQVARLQRHHPTKPNGLLCPPNLFWHRQRLSFHPTSLDFAYSPNFPTLGAPRRTTD